MKNKRYITIRLFVPEELEDEEICDEIWFFDLINNLQTPEAWELELVHERKEKGQP